MNKKSDDLTYDKDGYFVYTGVSPLSEDTDVDDEDEDD